MNGFIDEFLGFVQLHKELGYVAMFFISALESLAFVGELIPGTTLLVLIGALAAKGVIDAEILIVSSSLGAFLGDVISFWLGTKGEGVLGRFGKYIRPEYIEKGRIFVNRHGSKSVFLGRFIGPLRPIVPFVTGLLRMDVRKFILWDIISAFLWSLTFIYLGNAIGILWEFAKLWSTRGGLLIIILILMVIITIMLRKYIAQQSMVFLIHTGRLRNSFKDYLNSRPSTIARFFARRLDSERIAGLKFTLGIILFSVILIIFSSIVLDIAKDSSITDPDLRMAGYLYLFRTPGMVKFFSWLGMLGNIWVISALGVAVMAIMWLVKEPGYIFPMWAGIAGSFICNYTGGLMIRRPVPDTPAIAESIYYFPSANATSSMMFYGFIIYFVFRTFNSLRVKMNIAFFLVPLIVIIGFSRVYLGVYYYTDVQAGWLLGALWLIISMGMAEYLEFRHPHEHIHAVSKKVKAFSAAFIALWLVVFVFFGLIEYSKLVDIKTIPEKNVVTKPEDVLFEYRMPVFTESLFGEHREPLNIIFSVKSREDLIRCMEISGWHLADEQDFPNVLKRIKAILKGDNYYTSPVVPSFWRNAIQDLAFEMPALKQGIAEMHWVRLWNTGIMTNDGREIYVGSASYNISLGSKLSHRIKPDIDSERNLLLNSLVRSGSVHSSSSIKTAEKSHKRKLFNRHYYTDGRADVIRINLCTEDSP